MLARALALLLALVALLVPAAAHAAEVTLTEDGFEPAAVTVDEGEAVHFTSDTGDPWRIQGDSDALDSGLLTAKAGFTVGVPTPGEHAFRAGAATGKILVRAGRIPGEPGETAEARIPDVPFADVDPSDVELNWGYGVRMSKSRIMLGIRADATVAQVNAALENADVRIIGGAKGLRMLLVQTRAADWGGSFTALAQAVAQLRAAKGIAYAAMSTEADPLAAPRPNDGTADPDGPGFDWDDPVASRTWALTNSRFPEAWNATERLKREGHQVITGIVDQGFEADHPDLPGLEIQHELCAGDGRCRTVDNSSSVHGMHVAGIIGAAHEGEGTKPGTTHGVDGANPLAKMYGYSTSSYVDTSTGDVKGATLIDKNLELFDLILRTRPAELRVINYSMGAASFNKSAWRSAHGERLCGPGTFDDDLPDHADVVKSQCTPDNLDAWQTQMAALGRAAGFIARAAAEQGVVIVQAAGNEGQTFCNGGPETCVKIHTASRNEFSWVSDHWESEGDGLPNPIITVQATTRANGPRDDVTYGADVAAPGDAIVSTSTGKGYEVLGGSSMAAPQVTGLIGLMLADEPTLSVESIRRRVIDWGGPAPAAKPADFTWSMPDRTNTDASADGMVDYLTTRPLIDPASFKVDLDACGSQADGKPAGSFTWKVDGKVIVTTPDCRYRWRPAAEGTYGVELTVEAQDGATSSVTKQVKVDDLLVVSVGDSIASGEGNPDLSSFSMVQWQEARCHRSAFGGPAQAARILEQADARSSVTLLHLACSGARMTADLDEQGKPKPGALGIGGLLTPYEGVVPDSSLCEDTGRQDNVACEPPQLERAKALVGGRVPDALLVSIGANDMRFSTILMHCMVPENNCAYDEGGRGLFLERIALLKDRYAAVAAKIKELFPTMPADHVVITQYPDPTTTDDGSVTLDCGAASGINQEEADWAHQTVLPALNKAVAEAAKTHGWTLADGIPAAFETRGYCAEDDWMTTVVDSLGEQHDENGGFHPNYEGHSAYAKEIVRVVKDRLGITNAGARRPAPTDRAPRINAFRSLAANGPAAQVADFNDRSKDGDRRIAHAVDDEGTVTDTPDTSFSADPAEKTAPDGRVDMRDLRRYRDAWYQQCAIDDRECPPAAQISLDGAPDHPKRDLNLDGCVNLGDASCGAREQLFARADLNGDQLVWPNKKALVPWKPDGTPAPTRAQATMMSDADVLRAAWSGGEGAEGYTKDDVDDLLESGDVEVHADAVLDTGASKATLQVRVKDGANAGPARTIRRTDGFLVMTVPITAPGKQYELVTTARTARGTLHSVSAPFTLKLGEDKVVSACPDVSLDAQPLQVAADGKSTSVITATMHKCGGRSEVAGKDATFTLHAGASGAKLQPLATKTDAAGKVQAVFTAGTTVGMFDVDVELRPGGGAEPMRATIEMETVRKLQIRYVWKQYIDEWHEQGTTRWTQLDPAKPDCLLTGVLYCIDDFAVGLKSQQGVQRAGTLTGGGTRFDLSEQVSSSQASSRATWTTTTKADSKVEHGGRDSTWWVTDPTAYTNAPVTGVKTVDSGDGVQLSGLQAVGDLPYHYALTGTRTGGTFDPLEAHAAVNTYLLVPQAQKILFGAHPDKQIAFPRADDGTLKPFSSCGELDQDLTSEKGYYVDGGATDYMAGATGVGRKSEYAPGDRPMPVGPGRLRISYAFAAVASYAGDDAPAPVLPDCDDQSPPSADFDVRPHDGKVGDHAKEGRMVRFLDTSTDPENDVASYAWDFGDGHTASTPSPTHLFDDDGEYEVKLTVEDAEGHSDTHTETVVVDNEDPEVEITDLVAQKDHVELEWSMLDPGHVDKQQLEWKLTSSNKNFPAGGGTYHGGVWRRGPYTGLPAGTYPLRITVTDKDGASASDEATLTVTSELPPGPPPPSPARYATCDPAVTLDAEERTFLDLVNEYREANGVAPVAVSATLTRAAERHANDMAAKDYMEHVGKDGSTPSSRAWDAQYPKAFGVGENLAEAETAKQMLAGWRSSSTGHNENMLNPQWRAIGIARAKGSTWRTATSYGTGLDCPATDASRVPATSGSKAALRGADTAPDSAGAEIATARTPVVDAPVEQPAPHERPLTALAAAPDPHRFEADTPAPKPTVALAWTLGHPRANVPVGVTNRSRTAAGAPTAATADFGDGTEALALAAGGMGEHTYPDAWGTEVYPLTLAAQGTESRTDMFVDPVIAPYLEVSGKGEAVSGRPYEVTAFVYDRSTYLPVAGVEATFTLEDRIVRATTGADGLATAKVALLDRGGEQTIVVKTTGTADYRSVTQELKVGVRYNHPPVADAGGPYVVGEGAELLLNGSRSKNEDDDYRDSIVAYEWDLDGDGQFDDRTGRLPSKLSADAVETLVCGGACDPAKTYPIALRVKDAYDVADVDTTTLKVTADFDLMLGNETMVVVPGKSNSFAVKVIGSKSHAKPVTLSVEDLPAGITAQFSKNPVTPTDVSVLKLTGGEDLDQGTFPIKIKGTDGTVTKTIGDEVEVAFGLVPICYGTATGVVTDQETGAPLEGARVSTYGTSTYTDDNGRYVLDKVRLGAENAASEEVLGADRSGHWTRYGRGTFACGSVTEVDIALLKVQKGRLHGTVVDTETKQPIADVRVGESQDAHIATTGEDGTYDADLDLGAGNADRTTTVSTSHADYWPASKVAKLSAATPSETNIEMLRKCTATLVGGTVTDVGTGERVPFAKVAIFATRSDFSDYTVDADADGAFVVGKEAFLATNNQARSVKAVPIPPVGSPPGSQGLEGSFKLSRCGDKASANLAIKRPKSFFATVRGTVTDEEGGAPTAGAKVELCDGQCHVVTTGADGRYVFEHVNAGYEGSPAARVVSVSKDGFYDEAKSVALPDGSDVTTDFTVLKIRYGAATVKVVDAVTKAPIPNADVNASSSMCGALCFTTDRTGAETKTGLALDNRNAPRELYMTANAAGYWPQGKALKLTADTHPVLVYELQPECKPARIRGSVVNAETGRPIEDARITGGSLSTIYTDAQGKFTIDPVKPGDGNNPRQITLTASADGFFSQDRRITIYCGAQITVDFGSRTSKTGTIVGTVTGDGGAPLAGAFVGTEFGATATTDAQGRYKVTGAPLADGNQPRAWKVNVRPAGFKPLEQEVTAVADTEVPLDFRFASGNAKPVAGSKTVNLVEDEPAEVHVEASDADPGDSLSYHVMAWPQHGELEGAFPDVRYVPDADWHGTDSFEYVASDGVVSSDRGTVDLVVAPAPDAPRPHDDRYEGVPDHTFRIPVADLLKNDVDVDGDALQVTEVELLDDEATLKREGDELVFTPPPGFWSRDDQAFLRYTVSDGARSAEGLVRFRIMHPATAPACADKTFSVEAGKPWGDYVQCTDRNGDQITYRKVAEPQHGTLRLYSYGSFLYTPDAGFTGTDTWTYEAEDETGLKTGPVTVTMKVGMTNAAPQCEDVAATTAEDTAVTFALDCADDEPLTFDVDEPAHGTLDALGDGRYRYTPDANWSGSEALGVTASDGSLTADATVAVTVTPVNDVPACAPVSAATDEDTPVDVTLTCTDVEGTALTYALDGTPARVSRVSEGVYRFTPAADWHGTAAFGFRASDGTAESAVAQATVTVRPVNDLPTCTDLTLASDGGAAEVAPRCADADGDELSVEVAEQGAKGRTSVVAGRLRYVPADGVTGADVVTYRAKDAGGVSAAAKVAVTITRTAEPDPEPDPKPEPRPEPKTETPPVPAPAPVPPAPAPVVQGSAALLSCADRPVVLEDVIPVGKRVRLLGLVGPEHAGEKVTIRLEGSSKVVAAPVVGADGRFAASAPVPVGFKNRDRVRYVARLGDDASRALRLWRRLQVEDLRAKGDKVVIAGRVTGPLAARAADRVIEVRRQAEGCKTGSVLAKVTPDAKGRFRVEVPRGPGEKGAVYRLRTTVRNAAGARRNEVTFSLPRVIDF